MPKGKKSWNYALKEVYLVALLEFKIEGGTEDYLHDYCLTDRATGEIFYDKLGFKFIELPKFTKGEHERSAAAAGNRSRPLVVPVEEPKPDGQDPGVPAEEGLSESVPDSRDK